MFITRHINATSIVAFIALLLAMSGGAFAINGSTKAVASTKPAMTAFATVSKGKSKGKKTSSSKGPRGEKGAMGAAGAAGPEGKTGPAGSVGPTGSVGPEGKTGPEGKEGKTGTAGVSVTTTQLSAKSPACSEGGVELTASNGKSHVCNGATGYTAVLPENATETGTWSVGIQGSGGSPLHLVSISFPIPLKAVEKKDQNPRKPVISASGVHYVEYGKPTTECPGAPNEPEALAGNLCIYEDPSIEVAFVGTLFPGGGGSGVASAGTILELETKAESSNGYGTWAVTAP